jgi:hypothetical protein
MAETISQQSIVSHSTLRVGTHTATQFIDVTDELQALVARAGLRVGIVNLQKPAHDGRRSPERARTAAARRPEPAARSRRAAG